MSSHDLNAGSLLPPLDLTRRGFIVTSLVSGFAASAGTANAQTAIQTSTEGLSAGEVKIPAAGGQMPAYRAAPAGQRDLPVVLVIQEIFGVHEHIKDVCRRLAKAGYLAIAPELFARQGDPSTYQDIQSLIRELVSQVPDAQVMQDLDATVAWAASQGGDTNRLGITGFCWGGRITWLYAAHNPGVKAGVAWYGRLQGEPSALQPYHPIDVVDRLHAPVLGLYGGQDTGIPLESVAAMQTALAGGSPAAKASRFVVYQDAPHAFHADYRPSYRKQAAEDGWKQCLAWFDTHLS